jgi:hypothetical protein
VTQTLYSQPCIQSNAPCALSALPVLIGRHVAAITSLRNIVSQIIQEQNVDGLNFVAAIRANLLASQKEVEREIALFQKTLAPHAEPLVCALMEARTSLILSELDQALHSLDCAVTPLQITENLQADR